MKKIFKTFIFLGLLASVTSCKKYLDVNTDPNNVTQATPDLILPQALASTASLTSNTYNMTYGGDLGGYIANAGGVSGYGNFWTFTFNSGDYGGLWSGTFDNLQDYQYILNNSTTTGDYKYYNAVARLMKSYDYLKLVDAYGDVPYSQALQGAAIVAPAYDTGASVYKACLADIDLAISTFKSASVASNYSLASFGTATVDITVYSSITGTASNHPMSYNATTLLNGYDMTNWIKFANTVKLRALIRIQKADVTTFNSYKAAMAALTTNDYISSDVLINPGYLQQSGKQNPLFTTYVYSNTGSGGTTSYLPTKFVVAFYDGTKLTDGKQSRTSAGVVTYTDAGRGNLIYRDYFLKNQLGFQSTDATQLPISPTAGNWYVGAAGNGNPTKLAALGYGVFKGFDQGTMIMSAAESYFLQAEGSMIGLTSTANTPLSLFEQGITASYAYLDKDHTETIVTSLGYTTPIATITPATQLATYKANNPTSYLVNFALATTPAQQLEAIITQKYIALNMLNNDEGWNEYRRTLYPVSIPPSATANAASPTLSFAPNFVSITTPRSDGLAGRIIYPSSETSYNAANVPAVNTSTSLVFWDARPKN